MVTMQQIADACGVSRGTVDRALHNKPGIRPEVADRVREKARDMGYISARLMPSLLNTWKIGVVLHSAASDFVKELAHLFEQFPNSSLLALMPLANSLIREKINQISEKNGIPVVTLNTDIGDANRLAYIGPDDIAAGRSAAALMGMLTGGRGHILPILGQQSGHYADSQRLTGFLEEMSADYPNIEILHPECCFLDGELAKRITCRAIQADPELNGIFVSSMGRRGVAKALQETGTAGKIHMIIHDITPSNLSLVRQGIVDFVIGQDIETQGTRPIQILYEYLSNHQMPEQRIQLTDISIKFRCNIPPEA